ncbi:MAG TPA: FAD-binding oxidoreductase [Anaerolineales bacterium]|nr:FAD-binding oxidoreductase [Anaerolineales bacterium]
MSTTLETNELKSIDELRQAVKGTVLTADDAGYDAARQVWNLAVEQHPAVIVIAQSAEDIAEAVGFANANDLDIAVKATGHGTIREANGSLLIVTAHMNDVQIDAAAQTAWISAGTKWGRVLEQAQAVGLAPLLGSSPDVGAVGYTLGGGMGWLARHYGLSIDNVNYFEVVTAQGEIVTASSTENSDLFWALRGGGGNFAVVTGMEVRLVPVKEVYAGNLYYPAELAPEVFARFETWAANAPDELTSSVVLMNFPPIPEMPEFMRGQSFVMVRGCYSGRVEDGEALVKYWRDWQSPVVDDFKVMPFSQAATISNDPVDPTPGQSSGAWLKDLGAETAETLIHFVLPHGAPPKLVMAEVRHAGGQISKIDPGSTAYGNRDAQFSLQVVGFTPTPQSVLEVREHIANMKQALEPHMHGGVYLNFLEGAEARQRTRQGFSAENFKCLQDIKAKYDPQNRFNHSYVFASK